MATYHGTSLEAFLQAAHGIFQEIARRQLLRDARIDRWTIRSIGSPVLTLTWSRDHGVRHNVHVGVVDGVDEMVAEVEINSWRDAEPKINNKDAESVFRSITHKSLPTIRDIDKRISSWSGKNLLRHCSRRIRQLSRSGGKICQDLHARIRPMVIPAQLGLKGVLARISAVWIDGRRC
jgi:hypothetical protein